MKKQAKKKKKKKNQMRKSINWKEGIYEPPKGKICK